MNPTEVTQRFVQAYYNLYQHRIISMKKQFAAAAGTTTTNFNLMSSGKRDVTVKHLCNIIHAYNINPTWLFTGCGSFFANGDN